MMIKGNNRVVGPTPAGGDYSEIFFLDDRRNVVDARDATHGAIRECLTDGTLVKETWFRIDQKNDHKPHQKGVTMEFAALIAERRSIRSYEETTVSHQDLEKIVTAAQMAPSWKNWQASRTYVVEGKEKQEELREKALPAFNQNSSKNAVLIVTTFVKGLVGHTNGAPDNELGDKWGAYDLGLHDAYLILAAKDAGYDTLIMGIRDADQVRSVLGIPETEEVVSVIALGKRAKEPVNKPRKELSEVATFL